MNILIYDLSRDEVMTSLVTTFDRSMKQVVITPEKEETIVFNLGINVCTVKFVRDAGGKGQWTIYHTQNVQTIATENFVPPQKT